MQVVLNKMFSFYLVLALVFVNYNNFGENWLKK